MHKPIAHITCKLIRDNEASHKGAIINIWANIKNKPLVKRKNATCFFVLPLLLYKNILVPERKTNTGAQKCVIHLVINKIGDWL